MKNYTIFLLLLITTTLDCYFDKYRAQKAYHQGDIKQAQLLLDEMLTQQPDDAEVAYNLGKVALKQKEYTKAAAYFDCVAKTDCMPSLKEQAWYDHGLSQVYQQQWEQALADFEKVVAINPHNEYAQKMIDQIKKILEEKKQQEEQQKQDQSNDQQQSDEQQDNDQKNDSQKNDQKDNQDKLDDPSDKDGSGGKKDNENSEQNHNNKDNNDSQEGKQHDQQKDAEHDQQSGDEQKQKEQPSEQHDTSQDEKQNKDSNNKTDQSTQEQQSSQQKNNDQAKSENAAANNASEQALQETKNDGTNDKQKPADKETMLLQLVEQHDAKMSKALFKRNIQQQMPSRYGQKNW